MSLMGWGKNRLLRPIVQAMRWPFYVLDKRRRKPSQWWPQTRRYIGIADAGCSPRMDILTSLLERTLDFPGDIAECGVFQGHTSIALGLVVKERCLGKKLYALDSFEGFDEVADKEVAYLADGVENPLLKKGAFAQTSLELIQRKIRMTDLERIVFPVKGNFRDTLPTLPSKRFCFVHLDCDLGEPYRECLLYFYPMMVPGGIICFDEYRFKEWPLATQAIDDFFKDKPEKPQKVLRNFKGKTFSRWHVKKAV